MARVAIIGEPHRIDGYGVHGAILCPANDQAGAVRAWRELPDDIDVVVLTPSAARWLASEIARRPWVLPVLLAETLQSQTAPGGDGLRRGDGLAGHGPGGAGPQNGSLAEPGTPFE